MENEEKHTKINSRKNAISIAMLPYGIYSTFVGIVNIVVVFLYPYISDVSISLCAIETASIGILITIVGILMIIIAKNSGILLKTVWTSIGFLFIAIILEFVIGDPNGARIISEGIGVLLGALYSLSCRSEALFK